jgi:hypothetical protein
MPRLHVEATRTTSMTDLISIAMAVAFFTLAVAYTYGCERLRGLP